MPSEDVDWLLDQLGRRDRFIERTRAAAHWQED
jgi:hypothetical protein